MDRWTDVLLAEPVKGGSGRGRQDRPCTMGCSGQHSHRECPFWLDDVDIEGEEGGKDDRPGLACVRSDHCWRVCDPHIWDEDGENVVGYTNCQCDCCTGRCRCREERRRTGEEDDHVCSLSWDEDEEEEEEEKDRQH